MRAGVVRGKNWWPMLSVVGMAGHDDTMPSVHLDNKDAIIVEEALAEDLQGEEAGIRHYKKGMWTVSELLVLQAVRREDFERQAKGGNREKHRCSNVVRLIHLRNNCIDIGIYCRFIFGFLVLVRLILLRFLCVEIGIYCVFMFAFWVAGFDAGFWPSPQSARERNVARKL